MIEEIEQRRLRNRPPDPHPEGHPCRECQDGRDIDLVLGLLKAARDVHQPEPVPSISETSYKMTGTLPGTMAISDFASRLVTVCKGCHTEWPCETAISLGVEA